MSAAVLRRAREALVAGKVPTPPPEDVFVGDGDFLAIAEEFLGYFVEVGGLRPSDRVLDVGCGIGRMAAGLLPYLDPDAGGRYLGIDPVAGGIAWCREAFAGAPHFAFRHVDVANALYNPDGATPDHRFTLPAADGTVDFAILTSVFTHMAEGGIARYVAELGRVLAPGGRVFATAFLFDGPSPAAIGPVQHLHFTERSPETPWRWHAAGLPPLAAVAFAAEPFRAMVEAGAGRPVRLLPGRWRGGAGPWFQDLMVAGPAP